MLGSYTVAKFNSASDGRGGTVITDPPVQSAGEQVPAVIHGSG
jgi:hypothetical protein